MKIAVVGGTSSLAHYLIPVLSKENEVISLGRYDCNSYCDLRDNLNSIIIPPDVDVLIHLAAAFEGKTDEEIIQTEEINAIGTLKICMAAQKANVEHLILISSQSATLTKDSLYYSIYSISKHHSEELARYYCHSNNLPLTILRPSQIYDKKGQFRKHQPLLYLMVDSAEQGEDVKIYGRHDALRNYIYVEDLVKIIIGTIEKRCEGTFSCNYPHDVKLSEIAKAAQLNFNNGGDVLFLMDKPDIPDNIFLNQVDLYEIIDFYPEVDISAGIKEIIEYRKSVNQ